MLDGLEGIDLRAMVVDVDDDPQVACAPLCDPECYVDGVCNMQNINCLVACTACEDFDCDAPPPEACDVTLGAGLIREQGNANTACDFASGDRWIDQTEPMFGEALSCAANVGFDSTSPTELVMEAMIRALDSKGAASECNAGFLRPEAGLAVLVVTDEPDGDSVGNPDFWRLELEVSQRDAERIAFAGIIGDAGLPGAQCDEGGEFGDDAPAIRAFADALGDQAVVGSVCAETYTPTMDDFANVIANMCE